MTVQLIAVTVGGATVIAEAVVNVDTGAPLAYWLEMDLGTGHNSTRRRIIVPDESIYPLGGVSFYHNGVFNRTDATGRLDGSEFHTYPVITLAEGDVVRAEWVDIYSQPRVFEYVVSGVGEPPAEEPPAEEPPAEEPTGYPPIPAGFPDASTTGLSDPSLLVASGSITVSTPGAVVENLDVVGTIIVDASNVTIRNCRVRSNGPKYCIEIISGEGHSGILIEDCELDGDGIATQGVVHSSYTLRRCDVHDVGDGLRSGTDTLVEDCYIHDLRHDGAYSDSPHNDGIQSIGGDGLTIRHNTILGLWQEQTSALILHAHLAGPLSNVLVEDNLLGGGTYTVNIKDRTNSVSNCVVRNNVFVASSWQYGPRQTSVATPITWTGNVDTNGSPI